MGQVCARSRPFTFCLPKPLGELETLKDEEDGEDELLLVVPRAQLLQVRRRAHNSDLPSLLCVYPDLSMMVHAESTGRVLKKTGGGPAGPGRDGEGEGETEGEPPEREGGVGAGERCHEGGDLPAQRPHEGKL